MVLITPEELAQTQANTANIRNICVLAHVDHGKTTLSDFLISSNGIISQSLAGKIRYMDSRPDEQLKGITMKASAISLSFKREKEYYIVNLIDSPGHVDFSSEVSAASRLSDGALVLVDVVEGVCIQTRTVLLQAFKENIRPCLILNKVDRLITEKQLTPLEAHKQLMRILEQVNAIMSTFYAAEIFEKDQVLNENDEIDSEQFFSPEKGNVALASSVDGWAFRINNFSDLFSKKLGIDKVKLQNSLWGNFYINTKTKEISDVPLRDDQEPLFVQLILNNIYDIYNTVVMNRDMAKAEKMAGMFKLNPAFLKKGDAKMHIKTMMSAFLPLADSILGMVVDQLPSPIMAQRKRILKMIPELEHVKGIKLDANSSAAKQEKANMKNYRKKLKKGLLQCDKSDNAEVMIFVSKMLEADTLPGAFFYKKSTPSAAPTKEAIEQASHTTTMVDDSIMQDQQDSMELKQVFLGFARIFSGTIKVGQKLHILGPRYNAANPSKHRSEFTVTELYLLMGRSTEAVQSVPAGNVFGIGGVSQHILKSATIASSPYAPIFSAMYFQAAPIVKIAVFPKNLADMPKLVNGLKLLNQADPSVEIMVQETGEHVIMTAGEVHAERCLRDITEKFAKCEIGVSPPLVNFRETICDEDGHSKQVISVYTANKLCKITLTAIPLPESISNFIESNKDLLRKCLQKNSDEDFVSFKVMDELKQKFVEAGEVWAKEWDNIWSLGPKRSGPNILVNHIASYKAPYFKPIYLRDDVATSEKTTETATPTTTTTTTTVTEEQQQDQPKPADGPSDLIANLQQYNTSIIAGFQLATSAGPLCDEPMMGVCFCIEDITIAPQEERAFESAGTFGGQIMSAIKEACRKAFETCPRRLVEAMYKCEVQADQSTLGSTYSVLRKRRAKILDERLVEGTDLFTIECYLPVAESFGFNDELRTETGGSANPQLLFSHWQLLAVDPFYAPKTQAELEEFGDNVDNMPNIARDYINKVRERKGLFVKKKIVEGAEKQRTMKRNK